MEKQNVIDTTPQGFTVRELYDIKERNYDWQSFKYELPTKYVRNYTSSLNSGSLFCTKKSYLDDLEKGKKNIPAPNHYNFSTNSRPTSGKMDKGERKTMSEQVKQFSQKQNVPGPGAYFKRPQSAVDTYRRDDIPFEKKHYLNEVEYLASIYPGVGTYNLSTPKHIATPKLFKPADKKKVSKKGKQNQLNQKHLNPTKQIPGTFEWMKVQEKKRDSKFFTRSKRFKTESKQNRKIAPNSYKLNNDWLSPTNLTTLTSTTSPKSVYYH